MAMKDAGRTPTPLERASASVKSPCRSAGPDASADGKPGGVGGVGGAPLNGPGFVSPPNRGVTGGNASSSSFPGGDGASSNISPTGSSLITAPPVGPARTRTRTNVSLPTGTLAAERGTWKSLPWRLWPVHQSAAAALLEPCLGSAVVVPETIPLRRALTALADRKDKALMMVDSGLAVPDGAGGKRGRDGGGSGSSALRGRKGSSGRGGGATGGATGGDGGGGGGGKTKLSCTPTAPGKGGVGAGGGVLVGVAHKRRRQDAAVTTTASTYNA